jgi:IPT/TIG domain
MSASRPMAILHRLILVLGAMAAALPIALVAVPAHAGLTPGTDWSSVTLPSQYVIDNATEGLVQDPVSCVSGTGFCMAIAYDNDIVLPPDSKEGQADLVTTDGGQTWTPYQDMPTSMLVSSLSCVTTSVCWAAGAGWNDQPTIAETTDGGQTWTDMTPSTWASQQSTWWPNSIDCVSVSTCWLAGMTGNSVQSPAVAEFTDSGASWTTYSNDPTATWATYSSLPTFTPYDPNGTYILNGISCVSALSCVAVGGLNESDGIAAVISTTDGGVTWSQSADPVLSGLQQLFSVDCLPGTGGLPLCNAAAAATAGGGPAEVSSADGGTTWSGMETYDDSGWLSSISCADTQHCWAASTATTVALVGTADGGSTWSPVTSDTANEYGEVSCASVSLCVATTDGALWITSDDGGLTSAATAPARNAGSLTARPASTRTAAQPVTLSLPAVSGASVSARTGHGVTVVGHYRQLPPGTSPAATKVSATIAGPGGARTSQTLLIGMNDFYSVKLPALPLGTTTVTFRARHAKTVVVHVTAYKHPAPRVTALSSHAGPVGGGNTLTISGSGFSHVSAVEFGAAHGTDIRVRSATRLTVRVPASAARARYVTVVTAGGGPSPLAGHALYNYLPAPVVSRISPKAGPAKGGAIVTLRGAGLAFLRGVFFGAHRGTHLVVISARMIQIMAPAGRGTVAIRVTTAGGTSKPLASDRFTY